MKNLLSFKNILKKVLHPSKLTEEEAVNFIEKSPLFDAEWYLERNPDVKNSGLRAAYHFYKAGWREGRSPSYLFNMKKYLDENPVTECPLLHTNEPFKPKEVSFSVIVASYNYENEIKECLSSLVEQQYTNFEVIVVDDGSKDNSLEVIRKYEKNYPFVHLFTHPLNANLGLPKTIQYGITQARGKFIAFCESDDYWTKDHLFELNRNIQRAFNSTKKYPEIIVNDLWLFGEKNRCCELEEIVEFRKKKLIESGGVISHEDFRQSNYIVTFSACSVLKDVLKKCDITSVPKKTALDWWIWRQIAYSSKILFINKKLTYWRLHYSYNIKCFSEEEKQAQIFTQQLDNIIKLQNKCLSYTLVDKKNFCWSKAIANSIESKSIIEKFKIINERMVSKNLKEKTRLWLYSSEKHILEEIFKRNEKDEEIWGG